MKKSRILCLLLSSVMIASLLTGCGEKKQDTLPATTTESTAGATTSSAGNGGSFTRAEYMSLIGDVFGYGESELEEAVFSDVSKGNDAYDVIQSCAEWEVIETSNAFKPDDNTTLRFAIETAVKSVGLEKIKACTEKNIDSNDILNFFKQNIADIDISNPDVTIDENVATQVVALTHDYMTGLTYPQKMEYQLTENTKEVNGGVLLKGDGHTAAVQNADQYQVGEVIYMPATEEALPAIIKITAIEGDTVQYENATLEEAFDYINISGSYDFTVVDVIPSDSAQVAFISPDVHDVIPCEAIKADGLATADNLVYSNQGVTVQNMKVVREKGGATVSKEISCERASKGKDGKEASAAGKCSLKVGIYNIKAEPNVEFGSFKVFGHKFTNYFDVNEADIKITFDDEIELKMEGNCAAKCRIGTFECACIGGLMNLEITIDATVGADGYVDLSYTSKIIENMECKPGKSIKASTKIKDESLDMDAQIRLTAEATVFALFEICGADVANAEVTSGVVGEAKFEADPLSDDPACLDLFMYVPLRYGINQKGCVLTDINKKWKTKDVVWDSTNSGVQRRWHFEDWKEVGQCTRGTEKAIVAPIQMPDGQPFDEYSFFEYEELDMGAITLAGQRMYLTNGEQLQVGVLTLPEGYANSDLVYNAQDAGICNIGSDGMVHAIGEGSTVVEVSTADGKYKTYFMVVVQATYTYFDDFEPIV